MIKAEHFAPENDHQSHAKKVQILLDSYKGLEKENFRKQSELLENLITETLAIRQGINKKQRNPADKPNLDKPKPSPAPIAQPPSDDEIDL